MVLLVNAAFLVLYGVGGLVATWLFPGLLRTWLYRPWMLTGPLVANDTNRTIMSLLGLAMGASLGLSLLGQRKSALAALALLVVVAMAKVRFARRRPDA
ncbi:hypothetical protein MQC88_11865 [Luteimonas sp. 50]|uniref:Uncharacterized protein n=1 Tax=Cognatiluteimonas sedimenti TaxID=2927791 RepID=A0ABT0A6L3_9GAMM|nr:hypothetical protein [Lysobacter sedimenti]MCJ0826639.1 hypothetical protein [Lysobacter sedimenti]